MIRLASLQKSPVNGFRFHQIETKWRSHEADPSTLWSFDRLCTALRNHRLANPKFSLSTDMAKIRQEVETQNAKRMQTIPGAESYYISDGEGGANMAPPKVGSPSPSAAAGKFELLNAGYALLQDWKSEGYGTVEQAEAERRAAICAVCPKNGDGGLERYFTVPLSRLVQKQVEGFKALELSTVNDGKLGICSSCTCPIRLKVWCELPLILKHLLPEAKADLDPRCWIIESEKGLTKPNAEI